jgi:hypothetical protein
MSNGNDIMARLLRGALLALIACIAVSGAARAQGTAYAGSFLEIPVGAKALGHGGAFTAIADDGTAFYWNPAGVSLVGTKLLSAMYSSQYGSIGSPAANFYYAGWTMPIGSIGVSANWIRLAINDIPLLPDLRQYRSLEQRYRLVRQAQGGETFSDVEDAFVFTFARNTKVDLNLGWSYFNIPIEIPIGVNVKLLRQSLHDNAATGLGIDAGAMVRMNLRDFFFSEDFPTVSFGATMRDIGGTRLTWNQTQRTEEIAARTTLGLAVVQPIVAIDSRLTVSYDMMLGEEGSASAGAELKYKRQFSVRAGLNESTVTVGAGVDFNFFDVDYAYLASSDAQLGQVHRLGLAFNFDKLFEKSPK